MLKPISLCLCLLLTAQAQAAEPIEPGGPRDVTAPTPPGAPQVPKLQVEAKPVRRVRKGLVIGGSITLGVSYVITPIMSLLAHVASLGFCDECATAAGISLIPIAGPTIALRKAFDDAPALAVTSVLLGAAQTAGIVMLAVGLVGKRVQEPPRYTFTPLLGPASGAAFAMRF